MRDYELITISPSKPLCLENWSPNPLELMDLIDTTVDILNTSLTIRKDRKSSLFLGNEKNIPIFILPVEIIKQIFNLLYPDDLKNFIRIHPYFIYIANGIPYYENCTYNVLKAIESRFYKEKCFVKLLDRDVRYLSNIDRGVGPEYNSVLEQNKSCCPPNMCFSIFTPQRKRISENTLKNCIMLTGLTVAIISSITTTIMLEPDDFAGAMLILVISFIAAIFVELMIFLCCILTCLGGREICCEEMSQNLDNSTSNIVSKYQEQSNSRISAHSFSSDLERIKTSYFDQGVSKCSLSLAKKWEFFKLAPKSEIEIGVNITREEINIANQIFSF